MNHPGLIVAAGRSSRMPVNKSRLLVHGEPALDRLVRIYLEADLDPVVVVGPHQVAGAISVSGAPEGEMIDSLARGIEVVSGNVLGAVIQPVDAPFTTALAVQALTATHLDRPRVLTHQGQPGHPVWVPRELFAGIRERPFGGLRVLLEDAESVPWDDPRILADLDGPEDLAQFQGEIGEI